MQIRGSWLVLTGVSGLGWAAMIAMGHPFLSTPNCAAGASAIGGGWANLQAGLLLNPAGRLAQGWAAMVLAMIPIALGPVLREGRAALGVVPTDEGPASGLPSFLAGYGAMWLLAGWVLIPAALWIAGVFPKPGVALAAMAALALAWRLSPFHRLAWTLCRRATPEAASGPAAHRRVLAGLRHGTGCVLTCWPLMLAPLVVHESHVALMLAATALQWADHEPRRRFAQSVIRAVLKRRPTARAGRTGPAVRTASQPLRGHARTG